MTPRVRGLVLAGLGAAAVLGGAIVGDSWLSHGLAASWRVRHDGALVEVAQTFEPRVRIVNEHRPLSRYVQGWDFDRLGVPQSIPDLDAVIRARVEVPEGPARYLGARASGQTVVLADGRPAGQTPLEPGTHELEVRWTGNFVRAVDLELLWGPTPGGLTPIPRERLRPPADEAAPTRTFLWVAAGLGALLLALALFAIGVAENAGTTRRRIALLVAATVVLGGTALRAYDYDVMPEFRENGDELFAIWNGWSLLEDGTARGWSLWAGTYAGADVRVETERLWDRDWHVISPYFEHPPALHLLVGAATHLGGATHWLHAKLVHARLVPIALSALVLGLMIAIGRRLDPTGPAPYLGALLYAVMPTIVLQTRVVKEEALLVPLLLVGVLFFLRWRDSGHRTRDLAVAAVAMGLCTWAKVTGVVVVIALVMLVVAERRWRAASLAGLVGLGTSGLLLVFGAAIDWDVFWLTQVGQAGRPPHFNIFLRFFDDHLINHNLVGRGWLLFLWVAYMGGIYRRPFRDTAVLTVPLVTYLAMIAVGSGNWTFGWYIMPLWPFLCLGAGRFLADLWKRPTMLGGALLTGLLVMYSLNFTIDTHWAMQPSSWPGLRRVVTLIVAGFIGPYALAQVFDGPRTRALARVTTVVALATFVWLSASFVVHYDVNFVAYQNYDRLVYFDR